MAKSCGSFTDPATNALIEVFPKKGETCEAAMKRVMAHHNVQEKK
jgi:hypothetical protein